MGLTNEDRELAFTPAYELVNDKEEKAITSRTDAGYSQEDRRP